MKLKQKHTPGPWSSAKVMIPPKHGGWHVRDTDGFDVCVMRLINDEGEANARLIAAAPELLEALVQCIDALDTVRVATGNTFSASDKARAAIAKATGGA